MVGMRASDHNCTPVSPPSGTLVHAVRYSDVGVTVCGKRFRMMVSATEPITCPRCKAVLCAH